MTVIECCSDDEASYCSGSSIDFADSEDEQEAYRLFTPYVQPPRTWDLFTPYDECGNRTYVPLYDSDDESEDGYDIDDVPDLADPVDSSDDESSDYGEESTEFGNVAEEVREPYQDPEPYQLPHPYPEPFPAPYQPYSPCSTHEHPTREIVRVHIRKGWRLILVPAMKALFRKKVRPKTHLKTRLKQYLNKTKNKPVEPPNPIYLSPTSCTTPLSSLQTLELHAISRQAPKA